MVKRIMRLLSAFALASLMSCASEPTVSSLTSVERQRLVEIVVVNAGTIPRADYQILGSAEGVACKKYTYSKSPTVDEAMQDVRIGAAKLGAEAVTNLVCESRQQQDWKRNCWETVICTGDAVIVFDKLMLSRIKQEGRNAEVGTGGSKGTPSVSSSERSQRVIAGSTHARQTSTTEDESGEDADAAIVLGQQRNAALMHALSAQATRNQGNGASSIIGGQVLSPSGNTQSKLRQPVENMNRCKQIRFVKRSSFDIWEIYNNCPVPVSVAWCDKVDAKVPAVQPKYPPDQNMIHPH